MVDVLGWINLSMVFFMISIYPLKKICQKKSNFKKLYFKIRAIHPLMGILIIVLGLWHGYLALGTIRFHTGSLIIIGLISLAVTGIFGPRIKLLKKYWRTIHKLCVVLLLIFIILHLFWRSLI